MVYYGERIAICGDPDEKRCGFRAFESGSTAAFARFCVKNGKDRMFRTGGGKLSRTGRGGSGLAALRRRAAAKLLIRARRIERAHWRNDGTGL